jgi:hypothetical protein
MFLSPGAMILTPTQTSVRLETALADSDVSYFCLETTLTDGHVLISRVASLCFIESTVYALNAAGL